MALTDFFSHKIFSSDQGWANRLCATAHVFHRYNGKCFQSCRDELTKECETISPRFSTFRSNSAWRDEMTAYVSHLGVARFRRESEAWIIEATKTAQRFLLGEAPDVAAFLRMQLPLFQFPNAMGVQFKGKGWVVANALQKSWEYVQAGMHVSPVRLLAVALKADAELRGVELLKAKVAAGELYALANHREVYPHVLPEKEIVGKVLKRIRDGKIEPPKKFEARFHLLNHMQVFEANRKGEIGFRPFAGDADAELLRSHFDEIANLEECFKGFDGCKDKCELSERILSGEWGVYFDALARLPTDKVLSIARDETTGYPEKMSEPKILGGGLPPLRTFNTQVRPYTDENPLKLAQILADPEITRIKKERRNTAHALMVALLLEWLQDRICVKKVGDSKHIDLWAELPDGRVFIFEVKSGGDGISEQVRKGISQLYEYRYRYSQEISKFKKARLCLVLPGEPSIDWMPDYLCKDRGINLCLLPDEENSTPEFHRMCKETISAQ